MESYWALARRAAKEGERLPAPNGGTLVRLAAGSGPEIWVQVGASGEVLGATPFFATGISYRMAVTGIGEDPEEEMDGWIDGWLEPVEEDEPYSGLFPLRVGLVDFAVSRHRVTTFPSLHRVEMVALAHEAEVFSDKAAYDAAPGDVYRLPLQSFVSTAHFGADEPQAFQESTALASGYIAEAALQTNPLTGSAFWWIRLATQGTTLHTFVDQESLGAEVSAGQIFSGGFWLLGRLLEK